MIHARRLAARPRLTELLLVGVAAGIALASSAALPLRDGRPATLGDIQPALILIGGVLAVHAALSVGRRGEDPILLPVVLCLLGLGLALSRRLAPDLAGRQAVWQLVALAALAIAALAPFDLGRLRRYRYSLAAAGLALVGVTLVAGRPAIPGGPALWLGIGPFTLQPSEVLKLLLVVAMAGYLADRRVLLAGAGSRLGPLRLPPLPYVAPLGVMLGLSLLLLAVQRDLGAALLLFAIALVLLYIASGRLAYVAFGGAAFSAGSLALHRLLGIVQTRTAIWLDPWSDAQGAGYQLVQALLAMGAGGVLGRGLGRGMPEAIPAVHTDFVYAAIVEELGVAGAAAVLMLYGILVLRGLRVAVAQRGPFEQLLAAGLAVALGCQALIILAGNLRLIPLTGITLPLLSHGGSSLLVSAVSVGLLLRLSATERPAVEPAAAPA